MQRHEAGQNLQGVPRLLRSGIQKISFTLRIPAIRTFITPTFENYCILVAVWACAPSHHRDGRLLGHLSRCEDLEGLRYSVGYREQLHPLLPRHVLAAYP